MTAFDDPVTAKSTAYLLRDWLDNPEMLELPAIVIPHIAVEGRVTLLSGREKIGKSTLVASVVAAASQCEHVFGSHVVRPVATLWYALDEPVADTVRRFDKLGADPGRIAINDVPRTISELANALPLDLAHLIGIDLVVIDTLSKVLSLSGIDTNSKREVEPVMAKLVDFFHEENVAAVFQYHTGKNGREYSGNTAIGASVDEVLTLRRRGRAEEDDFEDEASDDGRRLLVQEGRNLRGRVQLTCSDGRYRVHEETSSPRTRLLDALRDHGTVAGRAELAKRAGIRKADGLREIAALIYEGAILEVGRNLNVAKSGSWNSERSKGACLGSSLIPEGGTAWEPKEEPRRLVDGCAGSQSREGGDVSAGTEPRYLTPEEEELYLAEQARVKERER